MGSNRLGYFKRWKMTAKMDLRHHLQGLFYDMPIITKLVRKHHNDAQFG